MRQKFFIYTLVSAIPLALIHITALHFSLYWIFLWLDCVTHFLGGLTIAFLLTALCMPVLPKKYIGVSLVLLVFVVGVGWEVFEYLNGMALHELEYWKDTRSDLLFDVLGGSLGAYISSRILRKHGFFSI